MSSRLRLAWLALVLMSFCRPAGAQISTFMAPDCSGNLFVYVQIVSSPNFQLDEYYVNGSGPRSPESLGSFQSTTVSGNNVRTFSFTFTPTVISSNGIYNDSVTINYYWNPPGGSQQHQYYTRVYTGSMSSAGCTPPNAATGGPSGGAGPGWDPDTSAPVQPTITINTSTIDSYSHVATVNFTANSNSSTANISNATVTYNTSNGPVTHTLSFSPSTSITLGDTYNYNSSAPVTNISVTAGPAGGGGITQSSTPTDAHPPGSEVPPTLATSAGGTAGGGSAANAGQRANSPSLSTPPSDSPSWLSWLFGQLKGLLTWLFVPSQSSIDALTGAVRGIASSGPFSGAAQIQTAVQGAQGSTYTLPTSATLVVNGQNIVVDHPWANVDFAQGGAIRRILQAAFWILVAGSLAKWAKGRINV